jgi:hypothetical protein
MGGYCSTGQSPQWAVVPVEEEEEEEYKIMLIYKKMAYKLLVTYL